MARIVANTTVGTSILMNVCAGDTLAAAVEEITLPSGGRVLDAGER